MSAHSDCSMSAYSNCSMSAYSNCCGRCNLCNHLSSIFAVKDWKSVLATNSLYVQLYHHYHPRNGTVYCSAFRKTSTRSLWWTTVLDYGVWLMAKAGLLRRYFSTTVRTLHRWSSYSPVNALRIWIQQILHETYLRVNGF